MKSLGAHLRGISSTDTPGLFDVAFDASWGQGRAVQGGLLSAVALRALTRSVARDWTPRALMTSFAGPVAPGPAQLRGRVLRQGRTTLSAEVRLEQEDEVRTVVLATFGRGRPESITWAGPEVPEDAPHPDTLQPLPYLEGLTPTFTQHLEYRWFRGSFPFSGGAVPEFAGYARFREDPGSGPEALVCMVDAWPCPAITLLDRPAPASSMTWSLELMTRPADVEVDPLGWWAFESRSSAARDGYAQMRSTLWDPSGRPAAQSSQLVGIFDA